MGILIGIIVVTVLIASFVTAIIAVAIIGLCDWTFGRLGRKLAWGFCLGALSVATLGLHRSMVRAFAAGEDGPSGFMLVLLYPYGWFAFVALTIAVAFAADLEARRARRSARLAQ